MSIVPLEQETDERALFTELQARVHDAQQERIKHEKQWRDNRKLVLGDHRGVFPTGKHHYFTANRVRHIVDTHTAILTETTPRPKYLPKETGEPPDWFLKPEAADRLDFVPGHGLSPEQEQGAAPIDDAVAQQLLAFTVPQQQPQEMVDPEGNPVVQMMAVQVPVFAEEDFIIVTDQVCADAVTQEAHSEWEMTHGDQVTLENIFGAQVDGHKDFIVQWNPDEQRYTLENLYPWNCWIDPWARDTTNAEYYILREFLPVSQAKVLYPQHADFIEQKASTAVTTGFFSGDPGVKFTGQGHRRVIDVWTWWQRNHPYDIEPEVAMERGLVEPAMSVDPQPVPDPETGEPAVDSVTGEPVTQDVEQPLVTDEGEQVYRLAGSDMLVMPGDAEWPKRPGIRQLQFLRDRMVFDAETEFSDIPVARNKAMLIEDSPYGQGEPQRIAELNDLKNRLWSIWHDYFKYFRSPEQAIPQSVYESTKDAVETLHASASKKWIIPDGQWMQFNGEVIKNLSPPQLGPVVAQMMQIVDQEIDRVAGMTDVLRGEAKSEWSGELFKEAVNAARGPIGLKARNTATAIKHAGAIIANLIIDFLDPEEAARRNRNFPAPVWAVMLQRIKRVGFNVVVEVSGSGSREDKIATEMELWNAGVRTPTILKSMLETRGIADAERIAQEFEQQMLGAAPPQ